MAEIKLSNFFNPTIRKRISIENVESLFSEIIHPSPNSEALIHKYNPPIGISDA